MAAPVLVKCKSASFAALAIAHAISFEWTRTGSPQMARGDGASTMQIAYTEGIHDQITVNALEGSLIEGALTAMGNGALVCTGFTQAAGEGQAGSGDKVHTWANASLVSMTRGAPLDGNPTVNYNFVAVAASGLVADLLAIS